MCNVVAFVAIATLGVLLSGCTPVDVVLEVDGRKLTAAERDGEIDLRLKLVKMANPEIGEETVAMHRKKLLAGMERHFVDETVLLKVARKRGLTASREEIAQQMRGFSRFLGRLYDSERSLAASVARREVLCEKARQSIAAGISDKVSATELDEALNRLKSYSEMVAATNRLVYAHATNVWRKISGGMDFAEAARLYDESDDRTSCEWGQFPLAAFAEEPALKSVVEKMRVGCFSGPVEGDGGLVIVKLKNIDTAVVPPRYELERIFFRLPEAAPQMTVGAVTKLISGEKKRTGLEARMDELRRAVRVIRH